MTRPTTAIATVTVTATLLAFGVAAPPASADEPAAAPTLTPRLYLGAVDGVTHADFSASAAAASDALLVVALTAPLALELGRGDADTDRRLLAYGGGVAASGLLAGAMKALWRRPRPYNFHPDPAVRAFAGRAGADARASFPSGHAVLTFAAAAAGGWIYASGSDDTAHRAGVWFGGAAAASATAVLRVRAGRHYPSDVLVGAALGVAGVTVPALVLGDVDLRGGELAAMAGGVVLGAGLAAVLPFSSDVVVPVVVPGGAGVAFQGTLR